MPFGELAEKPEHLKLLDQWLRSYRPEELFDARGAVKPEIAALAPKGTRRMGANPHANGGLLLKDLRLPDFRDYAVDVPQPGQALAEPTRILGRFLRDVMKLNREARNFRVVGPDETASNRLGALFEVTDRAWMAERLPEDDHLAPDGRVMEILSEHTCQGWLEGYLLTGRHGLFSCYRRSSISWTRCSTSTPSGQVSKEIHGGDRSPRSTIAHFASGARTTTASHQDPVSSTTW